MFKKILVPIDFSNNSMKLLEPARYFAKKTGAEVHIIHVTEEEGAFSLRQMRELTGFFRKVYKKREAWMRELVPPFEKQGIPVTTVLQKSKNASKTILEYMKKVGIDLGFISTVGVERLKKLLIGSTTQKVIRQSRIPFLSINQHYRAGKAFKIKKILVTTDFSEPSRQGICFASNMARIFEAELTLLHVVKVPSTISIIPGGPALGFPIEALIPIKEEAEEKLKRIIRTCGDVPSRFHIVSGGNRSDAINEYAASNKDDLIIIPRVGAGFLDALSLGRVAEGVVKVVNIPVITYQPELPGGNSGFSLGE